MIDRFGIWHFFVSLKPTVVSLDIKSSLCFKAVHKQSPQSPQTKSSKEAAGHFQVVQQHNQVEWIWAGPAISSGSWTISTVRSCYLATYAYFEVNVDVDVNVDIMQPLGLFGHFKVQIFYIAQLTHKCLASQIVDTFFPLLVICHKNWEE